jgi:hypothetical protein
MSRYSVDQYGQYRLHDDDMTVIKVINVSDRDVDYQAMQVWRQTNDLIAIVAEPPKPSLAEYKLLAKQGIAAKADAFIDRITLAAGIPKSEVANFEAKAQAALEYKYEGKAIPLYSAIYQEAAVTGESVADLCAAIIMRFQQREWVNGQISGMRRQAGWAIDAATDHAAVDAAVMVALAQAKTVFGGFAV